MSVVGMSCNLNSDQPADHFICFLKREKQVSLGYNENKADKKVN